MENEYGKGFKGRGVALQSTQYFLSRKIPSIRTTKNINNKNNYIKT
jgi:hypothetical protein